MNGLNAIVIEGKVYEAYPTVKGNCIGCAFSYEVPRECLGEKICSICKNEYIFRFSQSLTDKINEK